MLVYTYHKKKKKISHCFEDIERSIPDLRLFFFRTLLDWLFALQNKSFPSFFCFPRFLPFLFLICCPLVHSLCTRVFPFLYQYILLLIKKKKKKKESVLA